MSDSVINFTKKREEAIEQKRREFERIMFKNFLGVYCVIDEGEELSPLELIDISDKGCLIQIPENGEYLSFYKKNKDIQIRIYFTNKDYLSLSLRIAYCNKFINEQNEEFERFGCEFNQNSVSYEALLYFVRFIQKFAEFSCSDRNESKNYGS